jgi:hypothetical protein
MVLEYAHQHLPERKHPLWKVFIYQHRGAKKRMENTERYASHHGIIQAIMMFHEIGLQSNLSLE